MEKNDQQWFNDLYTKNYRKLFSMAYHILHSEAHAEELVQDAFMILLCKFEVVRAHENPDLWLKQTMRYLLGNELKKEWRKKEVPFLYEYQTQGHLTESLEEILPAGLSKQEREILIWVYQDGLSHEEVAARLGKSPAACRVRLYRAKEHCKRLLLNI